MFFNGNFLAGLAFTLLAPMILARTGDNTVILGAVYAASAVGGVIGGAALSAWGGPRRRVHGVLLGWAAIGVCQVLMGFGMPFWFVGIFLADLVNPTLNGSNQAIWQAKVPPDVQGRVFSVRRMIAQITGPAAMLICGPLADQVFEPAMQPGGTLAGVFGRWVGTGPGAGMALIFVLTGLLVVVVGLVPYAIPLVREAEARLPDHGLGPEPQA